MLRKPSNKARALAVDLGTARTRIAVEGHGLLLDEPTLLACDADGSAVAAGWAAWHAAGESGAQLRHPVRQASVVDPVRCVQFLKLLLTQAGVVSPPLAAVAVPALATEREAHLLAGCVAAATGARVARVDAGVAAARGASTWSSAAVIVDIGAGILEAAVIVGQRAHAYGRADVGLQSYLHDSADLLSRLDDVLERLLRQLPAQTARGLRSQPLRLVGGGPLMPGLVRDLRERLKADVQVPDDPRSCLIDGLSARARELAQS